jgi:hypothetical protein
MNGLQAAPESPQNCTKDPSILFRLYGTALRQEEAASTGIDLVFSKTEDAFYPF